jgi:hypothetical protein
MGTVKQVWELDIFPKNLLKEASETPFNQRDSKNNQGLFIQWSHVNFLFILFWNKVSKCIPHSF